MFNFEMFFYSCWSCSLSLSALLPKEQGKMPRVRPKLAPCFLPLVLTTMGDILHRDLVATLEASTGLSNDLLRLSQLQLLHPPTGKLPLLQLLHPPTGELPLILIVIR